MRALGFTGALGDALGPAVIFFAVVTQLGDLWLLALLTTLVYWLDDATPLVGADLDRERTATVLAVFFCAIALLVTVKPLLGLQRPPGSDTAPYAHLLPDAFTGVYIWFATADGYGFPSGHALGTTVVYGGLAWAVQRGSARQRVTLAAGLVTLISASRLALGVHYLVDVVAGTALGLLLLLVARSSLGSQRRLFGLATAVALAGLLTVGLGPELLGGFGLAVGGLTVWLLAGDRLLALDAGAHGAVVTAGFGIVTVAPVLVLVGTGRLTGALAALGGLYCGLLVVGAPLVGHGVAKSWDR